MHADIHPEALAALAQGAHGAPFDLLGPHPAGDDALVLRAFRPDAHALRAVLASGERVALARIHEAGVFAAVVPGARPGLRYHYEADTDAGTLTFADPYAYGPLLTDFDLYLYGEGHYRFSYEKFGAHLREVDGVRGVNFAVWAPNARRVSVIGDFNGWDARVYPMRQHTAAGVWELFIPGLAAGAIYKYDILAHSGYRVQKADPYAFASERRPRTASVVADLDVYHWGDADWMAQRDRRDALATPMAAYEVHLGSWRRGPADRWLTYRELAETLIPYAVGLGYTHLELMPVAEHPLDASWGYQVSGYYAATSRYGPPEDLMYFIDQCHQHGLGVILDWVPAHFPKDGHALSYFDGTHLYEHADARQAEHPDWGTYIFNYGRSEVRNFLISNGLFWLDRYHVDGLRVDAVSSMLYLDFGRQAGGWIPNKYGGKENLDAIDFLREFNTLTHGEFPGAVTIAEESTAWPMVSRPAYLGGLGFTLKWNMGWMHDTLEYISTDPLYRRYHHNKLTFSMMYAFSENFVLALSHDEVVHMKGALIAKMAGDWWQQFAGARLLAGYQYTHPGKKLNFMGQEIGQWTEWSETRSLDWGLLDWPAHRQLHDWMRDLNHCYTGQPALYERDHHPDGFRWIEPNDAEQSVFSYLRFAADPDDFLVVVCNFTPVPRYGYRIGVPLAGRYRELLNSDARQYGGSGLASGGSLEADASVWHGQPYNLSLTLPPLAIVILKPERGGVRAGEREQSLA